jgi:hypothetical protein
VGQHRDLVAAAHVVCGSQSGDEPAGPFVERRIGEGAVRRQVDHGDVIAEIGGMMGDPVEVLCGHSIFRLAAVCALAIPAI